MRLTLDPQLDDASVGPLLGDDGDRKIYPRRLTVEVENHLDETVSPRDGIFNVLDRGGTMAEPGVRFGDVCLERPPTPDASAYGMVQLGLAGK